MKKILILVVIIGAASYMYRSYGNYQGTTMDPITDPVYGEARVKMEIQGRSLEGVMYVKNIDQADCQKHGQVIDREIMVRMKNVCPSCTIQKLECKDELASRHAKLFNNQPTNVSYLSLARGVRSEREVRVIYWGLTVAESHVVCDFVPELQKGRKGKVSCIRPPQ